MNGKKIIIKLLAMLAVAALLVCCCACQQQGEISSEPASSASSEPEPVSDWDAATVRWTAGTELKFELRVKPGIGYTADPQGYDGCLFKTDDGNTVSLLIQGLDYEASFDDMLSYFKSKNPEKLSVGKSSQTIIVVYDAENVEICSKLDDLYCLTTKAPDFETAEAFFSNVMIKVEGGDYTALDLSEDFEEML